MQCRTNCCLLNALITYNNLPYKIAIRNSGLSCLVLVRWQCCILVVACALVVYLLPLEPMTIGRATDKPLILALQSLNNSQWIWRPLGLHIDTMTYSNIN